MATSLSETDRTRLDGIVQKMIANKESDENIQWVVNDFKQKYGQVDDIGSRASMLRHQMPIQLAEGQASPENPKNQMPFGQKVITAISNIPSNAAEVAKDTYNVLRHPIDMGVGLANLAAGGLASLVPEKYATPESKEMAQVAEPVIEGAKQFVQHPVNTMAERIIEKPINYALDVAALKGLSGIGRTTTAPEVKEVVKEGINKGIRPTVVGKGSKPLIDAYYNKAENAVKTIIENKDNLALTTAEGEKVAGLPKNLSQFSEAIDQTKRSIFQQYDAMKVAAGQSGATVDLQPIVNELRTIVNDPTLRDLNLGMAKQVQKKMIALEARGSYTAEEAQKAIAHLNQGLEAFYKNPSYDAVKPAAVDALIANNLRKGLDDAIESAAGPGYQALKNKYGALKTLEKEVNHRAIVDARKNVKGLVDFSDLYSATQLLSGFGGNPMGFAKAAAVEGMKRWYKFKNDPNTHISKMFEKADKLLAPTFLESLPSSKAIANMTLQTNRLEPQKNSIQDALSTR